MSDREFWYNVRTGEVEEGPQSGWTQLLGPYGTREEASKAMSRVEANNEAADAEDAEDAKWDNNPGNDPD